MKPFIKIMCGLPGSGKTTYAKKFKDAVYISRDSLRLAINLNDYFVPEREYMIKDIRNRLIDSCLRNQQSFIIDECLITEVSRSDLLSKILSYLVKDSYDITLVYCSEQEHNVNRVDLRNKTRLHWKTVINNMKEVFEPPTQYEADSYGIVFKTV